MGDIYSCICRMSEEFSIFHFRLRTKIQYFVMPITAKSVAVIGAGPSGAIATNSLVKEQAFETIRVFDRSSVIGGAW